MKVGMSNGMTTLGAENEMVHADMLKDVDVLQISGFVSVFKEKEGKEDTVDIGTDPMHVFATDRVLQQGGKIKQSFLIKIIDVNLYLQGISK